ncbi:MAG: hypothetical protein AAFQ87_08460 [Bacteroidota bacterium]
MKRAIFWLFLPLLWSLPSQAQVSLQDSSVSMGLLQVSYRGLLTGGDMAERYGFNSQLGLDFSWKLANQFYGSIGAHALVSDDIRDSVLLTNITTGGLLVTNNGLLSEIRTVQAGFVIPISVGRLFTLPIFPNPNSGIFVEVGGQYIQHWVNITPVDEEVAAVSGEYAKGYDRMTGGFGIKEAVGFRWIGNQGYVNFTVGLEFSQNFTNGLRTIQFDTGLPGQQGRRDYLSGFYVGWIFPILERAPNKVYYY